MKVNLKSYLDSAPDVSSKQKLFYNMSKTMEYIHSKDYSISNFNPKEIEILDVEKLGPIQYNMVSRIPKEIKQDVVANNIYNLSFVQISTYSNINLNDLKPTFLKENFSSFEQFLPEDDVPYLRGVIERGSTIYYYQYVDEKNKRQIEMLNNQVGQNNEMINGSGYGIQKTKATAIGKAMVDKETRKLYDKLVSNRESAFVSFLLFPLSLSILTGILLLILVVIS